MQPHLAKSLQNNDPPPDAVLSEVKALLSKPIQELANKDADIQHLLQTLKYLKDEQRGIKKSIEEYSTILSPIRRLPSAILEEIFYHCLPTFRDPIMSSTEAPLLLICICRSWRSTALSSHRIWAKLYIPLPPHSPYIVHDSDRGGPNQLPVINTTIRAADNEQEVLNEKYAKTMEGRRKLAETWLLRSGTCPLSISMKYCSMHSISEGNSDDGHVINQIFDTLLSFSHRIDALELSMSFELYEIFQTKISLDMIPILRKLRIYLYEQGAPFFGDPPLTKSVILLQAPNLRHLSISAEHLAIFDSINFPSTWTDLTELNLHSFITSASAVHLLRLCKNLDRCKLTISICYNVYIDPEDVLSLPRLRFLSLKLCDFDRMALLYRRIDAPHLTQFDYQGKDLYRSYSPPYNSQDPLNTYPSPVLSLLEKSRKIKTLSLDPSALNRHDILFSFRFANQLTHLILGKRQRRLASFQHPPYAPLHLSGSGPGNFDLDLLIIEEDSDSANTSPSAFGKEILLPRLEVFEAYLSPFKFTDESLRRFIIGRLGEPAHRKGISSLKSVTVVFGRQMEMDITEAVYQHAKEGGVKIVLQLDYLFEPPSLTDGKYTNIFSPWYGLLPNDSSWNYPEVDAESS